MRYRFARAVQALLRLAGCRLRRLPAPLLHQPEGELTVDLEQLLARHGWRTGGDRLFFVQVGAYDGLANDPIHDLVVAHRWQGVLVEPQTEAFAALKRTYCDQPQLVLRNAALAARAGPQPLYRLRPGAPGLPEWAAQLASFRREALLAHRDAIPGIEGLIEVTEVEGVTFDQLLGERRSVDLLLVDAEGYDHEIVHLFFASGREAAVVCFEHKHLRRSEHATVVGELLERGYRVALNGPDTLAARP